MSPERLYPLGGETESARATFASDIFSFAMVIYEVRGQGSSLLIRLISNPHRSTVVAFHFTNSTT